MEGASLVKFPYREEGNPPILRPTVDVRLRLNLMSSGQPGH
jgi:hypothetical protein